MIETKPTDKDIVQILDLHFLGLQGAIGAYALPHAGGVALVECGPGSTIPALLAGLASLGYKACDITDVFLTHIHLDHAGASGWLARQGATIHVHPAGAAHMLDPEKLLASAKRIYQDQMDYLWGEFLPVPADKLSVTADNDVVEFGGQNIRVLEAPGHANHHSVYIYKDLCFTGDVGGIRIPGPRHLRVPMPPPELQLETWKATIRRLLDEHEQGSFSRIVPTHFGIYNDPAWHLSYLLQCLDEINDWLAEIMPADPPVEEINRKFIAWTELRSLEQGLNEGEIRAYEAANPTWMSAAGMQRYWRKYRSS